MVSPKSERTIEAVLSKLPGVRARASFESRSLHVQFDRRHCALPEIVRRLDDLGLRVHARMEHVAPLPESTLVSRAKDLFSHHYVLIMAIVGALCLLGAAIVRWTEGPAILRYVLVSLSFLLAGWFTAIDTFKVLWRLTFDIDVLMFAAAIGAAAIGSYEEGALLLVLFAFGGAGEELAMDRARRAIEALATLSPDVATIRNDDGTEKLIGIEQLQVDQTVVVRPFDRVPADGIVSEGTSAIDQSPITGESVPVPKDIGANVYAGTINGEGLLLVRVTRLASESTLSRIVAMVREAQTQKSPTQTFTEAVEKWYVPLVLVVSAALIVLPPLLGWTHRQDGKGNWAGWFYQAMAYLTAASPCALAIGTPAAVLSGIARAARLGVLIKGGAHLENLGKVKVIALDKTGTLTRGRPVVTDVHPLGRHDAAQIITLAAAVEKGSTHPLAHAIVEEAVAHQYGLPGVSDSRQIPGLGVTARIDGREISVGNIDHYLNSPDAKSDVSAALRNQADAFNRQGKTVVMVSEDGHPTGIIALSDRPREFAAESIAQLKQQGIARTVMLTGDRAAVADTIAKEVGVDEVKAELLPDQKLDYIKSLREKYGHVAMVGDGVNDAPALATATVGIAMGGAGTDVAIETADVALMSDDLHKLPQAIALSRFSRRIVVQNLTIALGVIAVLSPLAAMGFAYLGIAVLFHEGSTVVVVLNALRILMFKPQLSGNR